MAGRNINRVILTGNLTRDPELRSLPSGVSVCELGLAVGERYKDRNTGEWVDRPNFFSITVWGAQGEACAQYLSKGRPIAVDGRLRYESWEASNGDKRSTVKVVADSVQFLNARDGGGGNGGGGGRFTPEPEGYEQGPPGDTSDLAGGSAADRQPDTGGQPDPAAAYSGAGQDDDIPF